MCAHRCDATIVSLLIFIQGAQKFSLSNQEGRNIIEVQAGVLLLLVKWPRIFELKVHTYNECLTALQAEYCDIE